MPEERTWTIRVCAECGEPVGSASTGHRHKPPRNGIYTYADVREVAVAPLASLEAAESRCEELEEALRSVAKDAMECVGDWGAYASDYFQEKWDLKGDHERFKVIAEQGFAALQSHEQEERKAQ